MSTYLYKIERTCLFSINDEERKFIAEFCSEDEESGIFCADEQELDAMEKEAKEQGRKIPTELIKKLRNEIRKDEHKQVEFIIY